MWRNDRDRKAAIKDERTWEEHGSSPSLIRDTLHGSDQVSDSRLARRKPKQ
jgi:hypothetical protein